MIQPIRRIQIISTIEKYNALTARLRRDKLDLENYRTLELDEEMEKISEQKVRNDYEEIAKFLDEVI